MNKTKFDILLSETRKKELTNLAKALIALEKGTIKNCGNIMMDCNFNPLGFRANDMYKIIKDAANMNIGIERIDSGGTPTWSLI